MYAVVHVRIGLVAALALAVMISTAEASQAQQAVEQANAAPADRTAARSALERAVAAADDPAAVSEAYFRLGTLDEEDAAFAQALVDYQHSVDAKPPGRVVWVRNSLQRISWLNSHAEGNFAPLIRLSQFKRDPHAGEPAALTAMAHDADGFAPGSVRAEARVLVGHGWLTLNRPRDSIPLFTAVKDDPAADAVDRKFAEQGLVEALRADGRADEANVHEALRDPHKLEQTTGLLRRHTMIQLAVVAGAATAVVLMIVVIRRLRRRRAAQPR